MNRFMAIVEREMRKFFRSPVLMIMSMMLPIVQLIILGHAYGGHIQGARVAVVDHDGGPQAVKVREAFDSVAANIATFTTINYNDETQAKEDVRTGKVDAAVIIPAQYSRRVYAEDAPRIGLVVDNSDQIMSGSIEGEMQSLVDALNQPVIQDRVVKNIALQIVELYPALKDIEITHGWGGYVGITVPRKPFVREVMPNVISAGGYSGHGVMLSNFFGKLYAETVAGDRKSVV